MKNDIQLVSTMCFADETSSTLESSLQTHINVTMDEYCQTTALTVQSCAKKKTQGNCSYYWVNHKKNITLRQADWGPNTVPPPTVPTSSDGIVQLIIDWNKRIEIRKKEEVCKSPITWLLVQISSQVSQLSWGMASLSADSSLPSQPPTHQKKASELIT